MTFIIHKTFKSKLEWHRWFAWHPVHIQSIGHSRVGNVQTWSEQYIWWEWVERKGLTDKSYRLTQVKL